MFKKLFLLICVGLCGSTAFSQIPDVKKDDVSAETKKQAVALLRETFGEVNNLRALENRIGFSSELASMLWYEDEKGARVMFAAMISDFNQLLSQYDSQLNAFGGDVEESAYYGGFFGGGDQSEKAKVARKLARAMRVRQQIASSIAEHDAKLAFDFYDGSLRFLTNAKMRKQFEGQDGYFQTKLLQKISENDPAGALEYGRRSVAKGLSYGQVDLLKKIYAKDADKGAEFAQVLTDKFKSEKADGEKFYYLNSAIEAGMENIDKAKKDGKKPMFSDENLRDLAEIAAQEILSNEDRLDYGGRNLEAIEKYAPSRGAQIRSKISVNETRNNFSSGNKMMSNKMVRSATSSIGNTNSSGSNRQPDRQQEANDQLTKNLESLNGKALPKEERDKAVAQARKLITEDMPNKQARIMALAALATQIAKAGDKELAEQIMSDAQNLVNLQPKNYQDYLEVLMLVSGYAQSSPEKAFPILDDTIYRINETISALIKVGEFIDVSGDMIDSGEVQLGSLGELGEITRGIAIANGTIRKLAVTDFEKTRALTNRFDRPEARILAKMLVLRAILDEKKTDAEITDNLND